MWNIVGRGAEQYAAEHGLTPWDVEAAVYGRRIIREISAHEVMVLGQAPSGRLLAIALELTTAHDQWVLEAIDDMTPWQEEMWRREAVPGPWS